MALVLPACQTLSSRNLVSKELSAYSYGTFLGFVVWQKNLRKNYFTASIAISPSGQMRIDLMASMGIPVLSVLIKDKEGLIIFMQQKMFYKGTQLKQALNKVMGFPLDVKIFKNVLFSRPPEQKYWVCQKNKEFLKKCIYKNQTIKWEKNQGKSLILQANTTRITFHYSKFINYVSKSNFTLKIPKNFKLISHLK